MIPYMSSNTQSIFAQRFRILKLLMKLFLRHVFRNMVSYLAIRGQYLFFLFKLIRRRQQIVTEQM